MLTLGSNLTLKGGELDLNSGATINGGTLHDKGGKFLWKGGTLNGVTLEGPLNMRNQASILNIGPNGLVLTGSDGRGPGVANLSRESELIFRGTQTFDDATINLSESNLTADSTGSGSVLTLGNKITVNVIARVGRIDGSSVVNNGEINVTSTMTSSGMVISSNTFTNQGTITVANGDSLYLLSPSFTNLAAGTLTGGAYEVDAGSTFTLENDDTVTTDDALIILSGVDSVIQTSLSQEVPIEATLTTIGSAGTLKLLAGRDWTSTLAMTNFGTLVLGGGTFAPGGLTNNGLISGNGVIDVAVANSGVIRATSGALDLTRSVTGSGRLKIGAGATLEVDRMAEKSLKATFKGAGGVLALGQAGKFNARIAGFAPGDAIDLLGQAATSATLQAGDKLVIMNGTQTIATLRLSGDYAGDSFAVASDGHGGTTITVSAGLLAQAMASMAPPVAHAAPLAPSWRPEPARLACPRAMMA
ncbi:MAG: hypothetical protein H0X27_03005 [Caulobacteraceae bacterium]|nr:hypothetical protein [Caulobacteraceae bacterium]